MAYIFLDESGDLGFHKRSNNKKPPALTGRHTVSQRRRIYFYVQILSYDEKYFK